MSSYLFVLVAGDLERLTGDANGVTVGVVTVAGKREQGRYALASAIDLLRYYNDYFGVKYPLPKLDLIAVPGGVGGAMENWGGIVFNESILLFDPSSSPDALRRGIFGVLAHEMAHQWFGDLVTMGWWNDLWLNEGFASWMQNKAADKLHPDWQVWLNSGVAKQVAMDVDARPTAHPIQQPVADESEAESVFDSITYSKSQAFIRELENYLGAEKFRDGIRQLHRRPRLQQRDHGRPVARAFARLGQAGRGHRDSVHRAAGRAARRQQRKLRERSAAARAAPGAFLQTARQSSRATLADTDRLRAAGREGAERSRIDARKDDADRGRAMRRADQAQLRRRGLLSHAVRRRDRGRAGQVDRNDGAGRTASTCSPTTGRWSKPAASTAERYFRLVDAVVDDRNRAVWERVMGTIGRLDDLERGLPGRASLSSLRAIAPAAGLPSARMESCGGRVRRRRRSCVPS